MQPSAAMDKISFGLLRCARTAGARDLLRPVHLATNCWWEATFGGGGGGDRAEGTCIGWLLSGEWILSHAWCDASCPAHIAWYCGWDPVR